MKIALLLSVVFVVRVSGGPQTVALGLNEFSVSLFKLISETQGEKNVFTSPFSAATAMSMLELGAKGESSEQILKALNLDSDNEGALHNAFQRLIEDTQRGAGVQIADYLLIQEQNANNEVLSKYKSDLQSLYSAEIDDVNFATNGDEIQQQVNKWVENKTHGLIQDLLQQPPSPSTSALLLNAVYFKAAWGYPFFEGLTKKEKFYNNGVNEVEVDMMKTNARFGVKDVVISGQEAQILQLPYIDPTDKWAWDYPSAMILILPKEKIGLDSIVSGQSFESDVMKHLTDVVYTPHKEVNVWLPKFNIQSFYHLKDILIQMGVTNIFGSEADLSGITGSRDLHVEAIDQKSVIRVDEKGTEAASATIVVMEPMSLPFPPPIPIEFRADHPFLFLIYDRMNELILFMGKVEEL